jgi:hypothetical protein
MSRGGACLAVLSGMITASGIQAQTRPWVIFDDPASTTLCSVIRAANAELVMLAATGQLVIVSGPDIPLEGTRVDDQNSVFFGNQFAGVLDFAIDGDGRRSVWWTGLTGEVIRVDPLTGQPTVTDQRPNNFRNITCDACNLWDDVATCAEPEPPVTPPVTVNLCGQDVTFPLMLLGAGFLPLRLTSRSRRKQRPA